jgi:hypothetical protein
MRESNEGRPIPEDKVEGFATIEEANAWLLENPEVAGIELCQADMPLTARMQGTRIVQLLICIGPQGSVREFCPAGGGVHFHVNESEPTTIDFTLQINSTIKFFRGKAQNPVRTRQHQHWSKACSQQQYSVGAEICHRRFPCQCRVHHPVAGCNFSGGLHGDASSSVCSAGGHQVRPTRSLYKREWSPQASTCT